ncbi:MAG TPA: GvpL/GvpF family gas vesicle protein [Streptosporangiaceae bacterium]|jgi:hypothetical protein|nr:GvpL/GvpF family gas vesicle protein [Streptosporangiaceae bacterium]
MTAPSTKQQTGIYVYGILPGDVELTSDMTGVGDPPGELRVVRSGDLAALVSDVDVSRAVGSPADLAAHKEILDASAADAPVLPMRFGAVVASEDAVTQELLDEHHDEFARALSELDGKAQYVVKGRYVEKAILGEVVSENQEAARLRDEIRGAASDATRDARIRLGEIINDAVTQKREKDTRTLGNAMQDHCEASLVRDPTHELDAVHVAFLVRVDQEKEIERTVKNLGEQWDGRVELRLLGPMAAYDFIAATEPGG